MGRARLTEPWGLVLLSVSNSDELVHSKSWTILEPHCQLQRDEEQAEMWEGQLQCILQVYRFCDWPGWRAGRVNAFPKITEEPSHPPISKFTTSCVFGRAVKVIGRNNTERDHNTSYQADISFYFFQLPPSTTTTTAEGTDFKVEIIKGFSSSATAQVSTR